MSDWKDRPAFKKGKLGEEIVDQWLIDKGFIPYRPVPDCSHPFDRLVASNDKRKLLVVEVKSKPARNQYPDTGIDVRHYESYKHIYDKYGIRVFIAFVDERRSSIYGGFLDELDKPREVKHRNQILYYPMHFDNYGGGPAIHYFPLEAMRKIADLTSDQCVNLESLRYSRHENENGIPDV